MSPKKATGVNPATTFLQRQNIGGDAPRWSVGIQVVLVALVSVFSLLGLDSLGPGLVDSWRQSGQIEQTDQVTVQIMLESLRDANIAMQNDLVRVNGEIGRLEKEKRELEMVVQYQCNAALPAAAATPIVIYATPITILVPTPTVDPSVGLVPAP